MRLETIINDDGSSYRDLNRNGVMDPYEDARRPIPERVTDLIGRLSTHEKVGLMFQTIIEAGADGEIPSGPGMIMATDTTTMVTRQFVNHFNVHALADPRLAARWHNRLQELAETTPHGIPVTLSSDPRHAFQENSGASFAASCTSQWPEPIGIAALGDDDLLARYSEVVRREYVALGIRAALHPQIDLVTEPRWARQPQCLGQDPATVGRQVGIILDAMQTSPELGPEAVACCTKHFPGGGPQLDGDDAHFPNGREQVYPGGRFADHLAPFRDAVAHRTSAMMPYYGMPVGLEVDGKPVEPVGFAFNRDLITGLLREQLGFEGVVLTDWGLITDVDVAGLPLPGRAWGLEHLDRHQRMERLLAAGNDQFGGEDCTDLLLDLIADGRVGLDRIDASVRRLLTVKFQLGLFDDPYVDEQAAATIVGNAEATRLGYETQAATVVVLKAPQDDPAPLLATGHKLYLDGVDPQLAAGVGTVVDNLADAEVVLMRIGTGFEPRNDYVLEAMFHQGSLAFDTATLAQINTYADHAAVILDVFMDRPAILSQVEPRLDALTASFGTSDAAWLEVLTGTLPSRGRLPFELPRSMSAVRASQPDVANDTHRPLYAAGFGLTAD